MKGQAGSRVPVRARLFQLRLQCPPAARRSRRALAFPDCKTFAHPAFRLRRTSSIGVLGHRAELLSSSRIDNLRGEGAHMQILKSLAIAPSWLSHRLHPANRLRPARVWSRLCQNKRACGPSRSRIVTACAGRQSSAGIGMHVERGKHVRQITPGRGRARDRDRACMRHLEKSHLGKL